jgi:hypothetical protein
VILTSTGSQIEGFWITAYKGIVQGQTWDEFLLNAEAIGANAILNICFDDAIDVDTLFHGAGVVLKPLKLPFSSHASSTASEMDVATHAQRDR